MNFMHAIGNVFNLNKLLKSSQDERLHTISVIGVGGVMSGLSARRMNSAGATVIGLATALGREGIEVFERISNEILEDLESESDY
jgi:dihydroorotate dehydrogenase (fumarate)